MMAIRIAMAYTGRRKVIKFMSHFHGWLDYMVIDYNPNYSPMLAGEYPIGIPQKYAETQLPYRRIT
ncbi:MAG: hypothetical protein QXH51_01950 [Candidatus Bathyarchaeia archaeon]